MGSDIKKESDRNTLADKILREAAALLLCETRRLNYVSKRRIVDMAKRANMPASEFIKELEKRLYDVGIILREVEVSTKSKRRTAYVCVIDPSLGLDISYIDQISAAILAIIYVRVGKGEMSLEDLHSEVAKITSTSDVDKIIENALRTLERKKLISIDGEKGVVRLRPLAIAMLPSREELDKIIIDVIASGSK